MTEKNEQGSVLPTIEELAYEGQLLSTEPLAAEESAVVSLLEAVLAELKAIRLASTYPDTVLSVEDLMAMGISRAIAYDLFTRPDFPRLRIGCKRLYVRASKFEEYCEKAELPILTDE